MCGGYVLWSVIYVETRHLGFRVICVPCLPHQTFSPPSSPFPPLSYLPPLPPLPTSLPTSLLSCPPQAEGPVPPHEAPPLSVELQSSLERERELVKRYDDLFYFLSHHTRESHVSCYITTAGLLRDEGRAMIYTQGRFSVTVLVGFKPTTYCVLGRCSTNLATRACTCTFEQKKKSCLNMRFEHAISSFTRLV